MRTVKADLNQLWPGLFHKWQVILMGIVCPMGNHGGELKRLLPLGTLDHGSRNDQDKQGRNTTPAEVKAKLTVPSRCRNEQSS